MKQVKNEEKKIALLFIILIPHNLLYFPKSFFFLFFDYMIKTHNALGNHRAKNMKVEFREKS